MTVESEFTEVKFRGLRKSSSTRVVDYRTVLDSTGSIPISTPQQDRMMLLKREKGWNIALAEATGEDSVAVYEFNPETGVKANEVVLIGSAITDAELVSFDGLERWTYRETREGDYPEPEVGQVMTPVQLKAGLV